MKPLSEQWAEETSDNDVDLGTEEFEILLTIFDTAPQAQTQRWRDAGVRQSLRRLADTSSEDVAIEPLTNLVVTEDDITYADSYNPPVSLDTVITILTQTWRVAESSLSEEGPLATVLQAMSYSSRSYYTGQEDLTAEDAHEHVTTSLAGIGILNEDDNIPVSVRRLLIIESAKELKTRLAETVLTDREFVVHHLANKYTYEEIAGILSETYGTHVTRGAANQYYHRAREKIRRSEATLTETMNRKVAPMEMNELSSRPESHLSDKQKNEIAEYVRINETVENPRTSHHDTGWELVNGDTFVISPTTDAFSLRMYRDVSAEDDRTYHVDVVEGDENSSPLPDRITTTGTVTRYASLTEATLQTATDIREAINHGFPTSTPGMLPSLRATSALDTQSAATGWAVSFFASVTRENSRSDPAQTPLTGHRYMHTNDAYYGRDTDDKAFRIIRLGKYDTFIQYDSGYGSDIPTHMVKDSLTGPTDDTDPTGLTYLGNEKTILTASPCSTQHDFGDARLGETDSRFETCRRCGRSVSTLEHTPGLSQPRHDLDFECDVCGSITDGQNGHTKHPNSVEPKVCDSCWNTTYFSHVRATTNEFDTHILTCLSLLTSIETDEYPEDVEFDPECGWIAKPTPETITHHLKSKSEKPEMETMIRRAVPCPDCGADGSWVKWVDITESLAGQALLETIGAGDTPTVDALFTDADSDERILTEGEHKQLVKTYHRLEREQSQK